MYSEPAIYNETDSSREKARKMSREIVKQRNDTTGGPRVSCLGISYGDYHQGSMDKVAEYLN